MERIKYTVRNREGLGMRDPVYSIHRTEAKAESVVAKAERRAAAMFGGTAVEGQRRTTLYVRTENAALGR